MIKLTFLLISIMLSTSLTAQTYMHKPRKFNKVTSSIPSAYSNYSSKRKNEVNCDDIIKYVKSKGYGKVYQSHSSESIADVTFYNLKVDYKSSYFAIVCFMNEYKNSCREYIYKVSSQTESYYSSSYNQSAGKAFWSYINPHKNNLSCSPNLN